MEDGGYVSSKYYWSLGCAVHGNQVYDLARAQEHHQALWDLRRRKHLLHDSGVLEREESTWRDQSVAPRQTQFSEDHHHSETNPWSSGLLPRERHNSQRSQARKHHVQGRKQPEFPQNSGLRTSYLHLGERVPFSQMRHSRLRGSRSGQPQRPKA